MKIPKKLRILGYDWKVKHTKESGGSFDWKTKIIEVGNKYGEQEGVLLHEIMETILTELDFRYYSNEGSKPYQFMFDHDGFCKFHKALFQVLKDNKLI